VKIPFQSAAFTARVPSSEEARHAEGPNQGTCQYNVYIVIIRMTGRQLVRILESEGWKVDRIRGSHFIMVKEGRRSVPVPIHGNLDLGTWGMKILRQAGIDWPRRDA